MGTLFTIVVAVLLLSRRTRRRHRQGRGQTNDSLYAGLSTDELLQRHQDYLQALIWAQATAFSDDDEALAAMSRRYTFHSA
mgnify:CR=1 FL=1